MYPERELSQLAAQKAVLRRNIAFHRTQCAVAAARAAKPLEWLDRAMAFWRRLSPLTRIAAVPVSFLVQRMIFRRLKLLKPLARWGPLVFSAIRGIRSATKTRAATAKT